MVQSSFPLITFQANCDQVIGQVSQYLETAGYLILESFDLQSAREAHSECNCPHHGTEKCNCQFVVLLVYSDDSNPNTLTIHSCDQRTELTVVDTPGMRNSEQLKMSVLKAIEPFIYNLI